MGDSSKSSGISRLKPPKIIALKKRPTQIPQPPTSTGLPPPLAKKSCLKPGTGSPSFSSSGSSTASSSSSSSPGGGVGGQTTTGKPVTSPLSSGRPVKSVQIKTSHNLVKLVRTNSGPHTKHQQQSRDSSLTSTFRELFRDFPASATGSANVLGGGLPATATTTTYSSSSKVNTKPPPYRNPPPPTMCTNSLKRPVKRGEVSSCSYDEIEIDTTQQQQTLGRKGRVQQQYPGWKDKDKERRNTLTGTLPRKAPPNNYVIFKEIRTKAEVMATQDGRRTEYVTVSDRFQNIPVKPRKSGGAMHRLENYCLFDPSVDFISEKDDPQRVGGVGGSVCSPSPGLRNYETIEPGPSNFIAETDLYILDSLTDAMYGQSIGVSGLEKGTPSLPGTPQSSARSSGVSTPVGLMSGGVVAGGGGSGQLGGNDRYIQVINQRML